MKTPEQILQPYIERPFRHTEIVSKENAIKALAEMQAQCKQELLPGADEDDFCILHRINNQQVLIWKEYNDEDEKDYVRVKFFNKKVNGYFTAGFGYEEEANAIEIFNKFKDHEYAGKMVAGLSV